MGTNSIDNAARVCHAPSSVVLKQTLGVAATTCSYTDWIGRDLIVFIGANPANNQPVAMKYLYHAKKAGTKVVVVNRTVSREWSGTGCRRCRERAVRHEDRRQIFLVNVGGESPSSTGRSST